LIYLSANITQLQLANYHRHFDQSHLEVLLFVIIGEARNLSGTLVWS